MNTAIGTTDGGNDTDSDDADIDDELDKLEEDYNWTKTLLLFAGLATSMEENSISCTARLRDDQIV